MINLILTICLTATISSRLEETNRNLENWINRVRMGDSHRVDELSGFPFTTLEEIELIYPYLNDKNGEVRLASTFLLWRTGERSESDSLRHAVVSQLVEVLNPDDSKLFDRIIWELGLGPA